ncbi:MAG: S1/P1 nuclease [Bacteroidales bacterium]|nr:S1/P1 nuclease [Bacteroidales bacterium]
MKKTIFLLLAAVILFPNLAWAWGDTGHRIVGQVALCHLDKKVDKKVRALLSGADLPMECTWGDFIKSDTIYKEFSSWHYCDFPSNVSREAFDTLALDNPDGECVYRVRYLADHLRKNPDDTVMLKILIHIVGDLGCPMHLARPNDRGGNDLLVKWFRTPTNLHNVWDARLIESQKLCYTEYAHHLYNTQHAPEQVYSKGKEIDWAWETYQLAEKIYSYQETHDDNLSFRYIYDFLDTLNHQLYITGCRLAAVLNYIYGK